MCTKIGNPLNERIKAEERGRVVRVWNKLPSLTILTNSEISSVMGLDISEKTIWTQVRGESSAI